MLISFHGSLRETATHALIQQCIMGWYAPIVAMPCHTRQFFRVTLNVCADVAMRDHMACADVAMPREVRSCVGTAILFNVPMLPVPIFIE